MRDRARAGDDGTPLVRDPRRGVVRVHVVHPEQTCCLRDVRGQHGPPGGQDDLVAQAGQHPEREGVEQHRGVPPGERAQHGPDQRGRAVGLVQAGPHDDGVGPVQLVGEVRGRAPGGGAVGVLGQGEHAGLGRRDGQGRGHGLRDGEREPPGPDAQRGEPGERGGARRAAGAADDEHATACVLGAVACRQRPAAQQGGGERGRVSHRPAPGAP